MIILFVLYFMIGFVINSLAHKYWKEMEPIEFVIFILAWPCFFIMLLLAFFAEIFRGYLEWIQK